MAVEDYMEPEVGIAMVATAIIASPQARALLRKAAVYSMAGAMIAGDAVSSWAKSAGEAATPLLQRATGGGAPPDEPSPPAAASAGIIIPGETASRNSQSGSKSSPRKTRGGNSDG